MRGREGAPYNRKAGTECSEGSCSVRVGPTTREAHPRRSRGRRRSLMTVPVESVRRAETVEQGRLDAMAGRDGAAPDGDDWYEWGPYLAERAWGTVREDYSDGGDAWSYFPHDHARSRAYR